MALVFFEGSAAAPLELPSRKHARLDIPPFPDSGPRARARVHLRFEDVTQDGQLLLEALPNALSATVWRGLLRDDAGARALYAQGIVPILSRFVLEGTRGPFSASAPIEAEGSYRLARVDGTSPALPERGQNLDGGRLMLDMWADLHGPLGRTYGPVDGAGTIALAGRVYAEHVLTRPFAPAGERRVTRLDFPGAPHITATRPAPPAYESIAAPPEGATLLEPTPKPDPVPLTFGLMHTDSNMHVNSLVYLRVFEEAALRRFATLGKSAKVLGRTMDIAYRKPCFAGQSMRVVQQAFEIGGRLGTSAALIPEEQATEDSTLRGARPHAYVSMTFDG
jgi:hypothetical protein